MSHISFVRVTITPSYYQNQSMLEIKTHYKGEDHTFQVQYQLDSFETEFEHLMKEAIYAIKGYIHPDCPIVKIERLRKVLETAE